MKIKSRITLFIVCVGFFSILIISLILLREMLEQPLRILDELLREEARRTVSILAREGSDGSRNIDAENDLSYNNSLWIEVYGDVSRQNLVYRSPLAKTLPMSSVPPGKKAVLKVPAAPEQANEKKFIFRVINYEVEQDGRAYWVQIARPMGKLYEEFIESIIWAALGLALSVLASFALAREASKRIIRPIGEIEQLARKISDKNLRERIPVGEENDELSVLANTLNLMLDRLQNSFSLQKEFLYDTSHELKTPLTTMRLAVESLRSRQTDKDNNADEETVLRLESQIWRMDRLVRDLLHLSAMEVRNDINESSVNLGEMICELTADYRIMAEDKDIDMTLKLSGNEIIFNGDREKLRRAFSNVLDNAIKYSVDGGYIRIEAAKTSEGFVITVENSGADVGEDEAKRVFDRFYRGEKSRSFSEDGGFGLGLAIVKKSVEIHKGRVRFESNAGINRLTIYLPGTGR